MSKDLILGLETSASNCSVALMEDSQIIASHTEVMPYNQANFLMGFIQEVLKEGAKSYQNLTAIAVNRGPGSFTGIRVGMATAQALAFAGNIPLFGLTGFQIFKALMARKLMKNGENSLLIALDTKRKDFYTAYFEHLSGKIPEEKIMTSGEINEILLNKENKIAVIGDTLTGIEFPHKYIISLTGIQLLEAVDFYRAQRPSAFSVTPFYMRPPSVYENPSN